MTACWQWPGSRWWRFDLHTHSPASHDFKPQDDRQARDWPRWLETARQAGLQAVAVTDHNTAEAVEPLQRAAAARSGTPVVVFPGVEITANDGTHLLLVLDPECAATDVEDLLSRIDMSPGERGQAQSRSRHSVEQILDLATDGQVRGVFLGAHVNGPSGLLEHEGQQRIAELRHSGLAAVEVVPGQSLDESWLDGRPEVGRKIPRVWCSDAHRFDQLGRRFTWIKMTRPNAEGLRLALLDGGDSLQPVNRDAPGDPNGHASLAIESAVIRAARYQGCPAPLEVPFNPWLNTIIGGRGTGKSSLVDFCRKAFRRDSELDDCEELKKAFDRRFCVPETRGEDGFLTSGTRVEIIYRKDGARFLLSWSHDGSAGAIEHLAAGGERVAEEGDIRQRFPIRIYSQKQLFELARDPNALLGVIDDSDAVRGETFRQTAREQHTRYLALRAEARSLRAQAGKLAARRAELSDVRRKLDLLQRGGHAAALTDYRVRQRQDRTWQAVRETALQAVGEVEASVAALVVADLDLGVDASQDAPEMALRRAHAGLCGTIERLKRAIEQAMEGSREEIDRLLAGPDLARWQESVADIEARYRHVSRELEAAGIANPNEYRELMDRAAELEREITALEQSQGEAQRLESDADAMLAACRETGASLSGRRREFARAASGELVRIEIEPLDRHDDLVEFLRGALGIESFENDYERLAAAIRPPPGQPWRWENLDAVVRQLRRLLAGEEDAWPVHDRRFAPALRKLQAERLDRLALYFPEDTVAVSLRDARASAGSWKPLAQGSPGQQTAALLTFVLGYGSEPIILDQPEDDLDNTLIYELLVRRLREVKLKRQVIVVTHNPNIVVHGDAEFVVSLDSRKGQTRIACAGGLQEQKVRDEICRVMEGGREAFTARYRRIMPGAGASA